MFKKNLITIASSFATRKSTNFVTISPAATIQNRCCYHKSLRDLERVAASSCVSHSPQDVTFDHSNLSYSMHQLMDKLEKLANLDPQLKKLLQDYSSDISLMKMSKNGMNNLTIQRLFKCNQRVQHYLSRNVGTHELKFLSIVNSDLADECALMNKQLEKHIFSTSTD